ncbi:MAG: TIR domain-containing protein [Methanobrevibacter sp.]|jgi:hypothetical protein|nr:TIR domain-containing protein [Candidatus Methanoflexus mossambicus]
MSYKNKVYVAFDGDTDIKYYNMLKAWKANNKIDFDFYDAHDLNTARDSSLTESIKNQLRVRFDNSKIFMILVGEKTKWNRKFIPWEIEQAINRDMPIIVVNLNNKREKDDDLCPTLLRDQLAIHIPFKSKRIQYAIQNWIESHKKYKSEGKNGAYFYID